MARKKQKKQQQSSVDRLPDDIRIQLQELLRDPRVTQLEATRRINRVLADEAAAGALPADAPKKLYKSSVNRYKQRMDKIGQRIRESRQIAEMWIGKLGAEPQGEVGKLLNEMVRNLAFEATTEMLDGEAPIDPKVLKDLAIAIHRLERAASENVRRDEEIRLQERETAKQDAVDTLAHIADEKTIQQFRKRFL